MWKHPSKYSRSIELPWPQIEIFVTINTVMFMDTSVTLTGMKFGIYGIPYYVVKALVGTSTITNCEQCLYFPFLFLKKCDILMH
ncbi:Multidrug export protein MepA [Frankliniella fusca]|uniref:Multidrug export protein MepA n=1 Tax=Frankliniella fusca TaxID=407009 RepID=A0AAE1HM46_9NEOP|nr:Multidrug export protein MepA [Frankliniella fusca]